MALRLNAHGWNVPQIAQYLDWAEQTVRQTIRRGQFQRRLPEFLFLSSKLFYSRKK
ncbi:helix-turn-helix domain-containing protein [aff. Roholtiella sp. LEGE 12411]|uniref:helix-turn-helix domain-containing protein n=1 Tax=aff. Roholtiella sp. LEGE 12411 TaxID=1828822 RepID=UPI00351C596D